MENKYYDLEELQIENLHIELIDIDDIEDVDMKSRINAREVIKNLI